MKLPLAAMAGLMKPDFEQGFPRLGNLGVDSAALGGMTDGECVVEKMGAITQGYSYQSGAG